MPALYLILPILCVLVISYRYYSAFIAARIMALDDSRVTPAHERNDGHNYHPTHRLVLFGHHFAAITGAGRTSRSCAKPNALPPVASRSCC